MAKVKIDDLFKAELWTPDFVNEAPVLKNILNSGILTTSEELNKVVNAQNAGYRFELPYVDEPDYVEPEYMDDSDDELSTKKIDWANMFAVITMAQNSYKFANIVTKINRDSDPLKLLRDSIVGNYWALDLQARITSIVSGLADKAGDALTLDVADDSSDGDDVLIAPEHIIDAISKQGDNQDKFSFIYIHSKVYADMKKANLITSIPQADQLKPIEMYGTYRVVVNDKMPVIQGENKKKYLTLIAQNGLIAYGDKKLGSDMPMMELYRNPLSGKGAGNTTIITRRGFLAHPIGWSYNKSDMNPTLANLSNKDNWSMKFKAKQQRFVALITN